MSHPDSAWSATYIGPIGVSNEPCQHVLVRYNVGPTSRRRSFALRVDTCVRCGRITRNVGKDLSWREYDWVRRLNRRLERKDND